MREEREKTGEKIKENKSEVLLAAIEENNSSHDLMGLSIRLQMFYKNHRRCCPFLLLSQLVPLGFRFSSALPSNAKRIFPVIPSDKVDDPSDSKNSTPKSRRPSGNREAVRKYREKKKAHTAYLEEQVKKLRLVNRQLIRKVQRQAILEAEILRLRFLLHYLRGKIDNEMGAYPLQKQCSSSTTLKEREFGMQYSSATMGLQCENEFTCFHPQGSSSIQGGGVGGCDKNGASWERNCQSAIVDCQANGNAAGAAERSGLYSLETMVSSASQAE